MAKSANRSTAPSAVMKVAPHLAREAGVAHEIGGANRVEHVVHRGQQRLADVEARKAVALEEDHRAVRRVASHAAAVDPAGPPPIDDDIAIEAHGGQNGSLAQRRSGRDGAHAA